MNSQTESLAQMLPERVDLSDTMRDTSLSLHKQARHRFHLHGLCAQLQVFDWAHVHATPDAMASIKRAYLTVPYLVALYASHYVATLFRTVTRGKDKGLLILDPSACTYVHGLSDGSELVIDGETVQIDGTYTRRLTISCRTQSAQAAAQ